MISETHMWQTSHNIYVLFFLHENDSDPVLHTWFIVSYKELMSWHVLKKFPPIVGQELLNNVSWYQMMEGDQNR